MKSILPILAFILAQFPLLAQNNCINDISTNPDDPSNDQLPFPSSDPDGDPRFINTFPWYENNDIPLNGMSSVYDPPVMTNLTFDSHQYYLYLHDGEELTPENGWELMFFNTGYYPDQSTMSTTGSSDIPYIVLYNRFTGILRVFGTYGNSPLQNPGGTVFDGVIISIFFTDEDELSGNLRLRNGNDVPLSQNTEVMLTKATALHTNAPSQWFSADFQLAYDPCICFYPSKMRLQLDFFSSYSLTLYGRSISVNDDIANGNNLLTNNFLTNYEFNGPTSDDQIIMYKVMEDFVDDYIAKLEKYKEDLADVQEYNKRIDRNLFVMNLFKEVFINGATFAVSSFIGMDWFQNGIEFVDEFVPENLIDANNVEDYRERLEGFAKKAIGAGVDSFIKKNFKKKPTPNKPDAPTASFTEYSMQGEAVDKIPRQMPAFFTPGTYGSVGTGSPDISSPLEYPIYNNAVGNFALLNAPEIKAYETGEVITEWIGNAEQYNAWSRNYQFQLDNDIYYAINDINVQSHTVDVAFEISGELEHLNPVILLPTYSYIDHPNTVNVTSDDVNTNEYYPLDVPNAMGYNGGANFCNSNFEIAGLCSPEQFNLPHSNYSKDTLRFITDYFSIDAISPLVFSVGIMNQYYNGSYPPNNPASVDPMVNGRSLENIKLKMKVIVDIVFEDLDENGENITQTLEFTYDVNDIDWVTNPLETDLANSPINYSHYQENLVLDTTVFDGSPIEGCKLVGTHYTCHGWDNVIISGDLTTSGGYTVDILGANAVTVVGESNISPEIVLDIQTLLDYSEPMPRADLTFVRDYCNNELGEGFPSYEADRPNKSALEEYETFHNTYQSDDQFELLSVHLYPVPTSAVLYLSTTEALSNEQIVVVDLSGRTIQLPVRKIDDRSFEINTSGLSAGSYYLSLTSNEGQAKKMFTVITN